MIAVAMQIKNSRIRVKIQPVSSLRLPVCFFIISSFPGQSNGETEGSAACLEEQSGLIRDHAP